MLFYIDRDKTLFGFGLIDITQIDAALHLGARMKRAGTIQSVEVNSRPKKETV